MAMKYYKPITPGLRHASVVDPSDITAVEPCKNLCEVLKKHAGRNNQGKVTVRHRGGGAKRLYRVIDFKRRKDDIPAQVLSIEYDPNRSSRIALLRYRDGEKRYIIAPLSLEVGMEVMSGPNAPIRVGNSLPIENIPVGSFIHNIELCPGKGASLVRSAGVVAQVVGKEKRYAQIRLPSGEMRLIHLSCRAVIGQVGNLDHSNVELGKAGRKRHLGIRPTVRGSAMSPRDHPHGGGEGRSPEGMAPKTPWGKVARGRKTRTNKVTSKFILSRRKK